MSMTSETHGIKTKILTSSESQKKGKKRVGLKKMVVHSPNLGEKLTCKPRDLSWANHNQTQWNPHQDIVSKLLKINDKLENN